MEVGEPAYLLLRVPSAEPPAMTSIQDLACLCLLVLPKLDPNHRGDLLLLSSEHPKLSVNM